VRTFRCLIMYQEVSLNQLEYELNEIIRNNGASGEGFSREFGRFCDGAVFSK